MIPTGDKAKLLFSVKHTTKQIHRSHRIGGCFIAVENLLGANSMGLIFQVVT